VRRSVWCTASFSVCALRRAKFPIIYPDLRLDYKVATHPSVHIICDNLSAHKTKAVCDFLARHPKVRIHYTPTYSSWLNQVEIWFSKIQRDLIARGIFGSVKDLARKIMRYIRSYNRKATPIKWSYKDASNRIKTALELNETVH
jgi:transposase